MFKEKMKSSIIVLLIINLFFLTYQAWFKSGILGSGWPYFSFSDLPLVRLFSQDNYTSVPKENLSKPRRIVVNDGQLWVPYYNTDEAFDNLDENTRIIMESLLSGNIEEEKEITYDKWLNHLLQPGVYVEYPIEVAPKMLSMVLNTSFERLHSDIGVVRDAIIIPSENDCVYVAMRDAKTNKAREYVIRNENISFPPEVLAMYTQKYKRDGYYEFAFNTLLSDGLGGGNIKVSDLVLFSDNESTYQDLNVVNPIRNSSYENLLQSFSFNPKPLRHYSDEYGGENYVENYATVTIYDDGYIEYNAVDSEKGIDLDQYEDDEYEILNSAIDFAEKVWSSVSKEPLNVLVSGISQTENGNKFVFDYYYGGREIAVAVEKNGKKPLYHAIEIETDGSRIISYRQYLREYKEAETGTEQENFMVALDYFVDEFSHREETVITDLYPGYFDSGDRKKILKTTWLCEIEGAEERYPKR